MGEFPTEACHGQTITANARSISTSQKCSETVVEPFYNGWPEH